MSEAVLEVSDLGKSFGDFTAVDGLSFSIDRGEVFGLLGVNGAGKTTAINMILGLLTPSAGSITVFGKDLAKHRIEILRRVNFCSSFGRSRGQISKAAFVCICRDQGRCGPLTRSRAFPICS